jgi:hypothetical protein
MSTNYEVRHCATNRHKVIENYFKISLALYYLVVQNESAIYRKKQKSAKTCEQELNF